MQEQQLPFATIYIHRPVMKCSQSFPTIVIGAAVVLSACSENSKLPDSALTGRQPTIAAPERTLLPTVKIAPAVGWPAGAKPQAAAGTRVAAFAADLAHPRWLLALPNGDVLVAETNAPPRPEDEQGLRAWVMKVVMTRAGAGVPSPNRITLLRDADGDGRAELRSLFIQGLNSPFGMALVGDRLYVANTDAIVSFPYQPGQTRIDAAATVVTDLPAGPRNHHWTKNLIASADGTHLYVTVGSNSNVAENGMAAEDGRAAIWEVDLPSGAKRLYATGLRNPNGLAWSDADKTLWTVVNERDELGSDLVPDYLTSVQRTAFYGWPYSYYVSTSMRACRRRGPTWWPRRWCPTTHLVRMRRRWVWCAARAANCRLPLSRACSSGCTARGTGGHRAATRWCSCHSSRAAPTTGNPSTC